MASKWGFIIEHEYFCLWIVHVRLFGIASLYLQRSKGLRGPNGPNFFLVCAIDAFFEIGHFKVFHDQFETFFVKEPLDDDVANNVRKTQNCSRDLICICVAVDYVLCRQQCKVTWGMFLTNFSLCFVLEFDRRRRQILVILVVIIFEFTVLLFPAVLHVLQLLDLRLQCRFFLRDFLLMIAILQSIVN